jgi:coenzyme PQQ synthesis protein D (PqqD)
MCDVSDGRHFAPADAVSWTDAGGDLVIYDRVRGTYHALNGTASVIWRALGDGRSEKAIVDLLNQRFAADTAADVAAFLGTALAAGLIAEVG